MPLTWAVTRSSPDVREVRIGRYRATPVGSPTTVRDLGRTAAEAARRLQRSIQAAIDEEHRVDEPAADDAATGGEGPGAPTP